MAMQGSSRFAVESGDVSSKFDDDGQRNELVYMYIYIYISFTLSIHTTLNIFLEFHFIEFFFIFFCHGFESFEGTLMTASAHIITAVIGSGVLSLSWALAQLGWIAGIITLLIFSPITLCTSVLLLDGNRPPDPITRRRNYNYMEVVKNNLGNTIADFLLSFINNLSYASQIRILPLMCQPHNPCDVRGKMTYM